MQKYNISANLVCFTEQLYDKVPSAAQMNGRITAGVRQGWLLSSFFSKNFSKGLCLMLWKVSVGGRNNTNLRFAYDIDDQAEEEQELDALAESPEKTCTRNKMEISAGNKTNNKQHQWHPDVDQVKGQDLGNIISFKNWNSCLRWRLKTRGFLKDCSINCSFFSKLK